MLSQGASIQQDYQAGKYPTYEHYSARLDEAARELVEKITDRNADSPTATAEGQRASEGEVGPPR